MTQLVVTWSVLAGLLGPVPVPAPAAPGATAPAPSDPAALYEEGAPPLWSYCRPELTSGDRHGRGSHARALRPSSPGAAARGHAAAEAPLPESGIAETPVPDHWLPCVPWGPGLSAPTSGMGSSGNDEEVPVCVEGAECGPVPPNHAPYTVSFSASKAVLGIATLSPHAPIRMGRVRGASGRVALGFPEPPFEPPRRRPQA